MSLSIIFCDSRDDGVLLGAMPGAVTVILLRRDPGAVKVTFLAIAKLFRGPLFCVIVTSISLILPPGKN